MPKILISESTLKNLIQQVLKEVLDEKFDTSKVPDPDENPRSLGRLQRARKEKRLQIAMTKCIQKLSDEEKEAAYKYYKAQRIEWTDLPTPEDFAADIGSDDGGKNRMYLNGMMFALQQRDLEIDSGAKSWLLRVSKRLDSNCKSL